jgi:hypothetical protein
MIVICEGMGFTSFPFVYMPSSPSFMFLKDTEEVAQVLKNDRKKKRRGDLGDYAS